MRAYKVQISMFETNWIRVSLITNASSITRAKEIALANLMSMGAQYRDYVGPMVITADEIKIQFGLFESAISFGKGKTHEVMS